MRIRPMQGPGDLQRGQTFTPNILGMPWVQNAGMINYAQNGGHEAFGSLPWILHDSLQTWYLDAAQRKATEALLRQQKIEAAQRRLNPHDAFLARPLPGVKGPLKRLLHYPYPTAKPDSVMIGGPLPPGMNFPMPKLPNR